MNIEKDRETKIIGIDNIDIITNGTIKDLEQIINPNQVGKVIYKNTMEYKCDITSLIMSINQNKKDYKQRLNVLIKNGGDMKKIVNYNGEVCALELANKFRNY